MRLNRHQAPSIVKDSKYQNYDPIQSKCGPLTSGPPLLLVTLVTTIENIKYLPPLEDQNKEGLKI